MKKFLILLLFSLLSMEAWAIVEETSNTEKTSETSKNIVTIDSDKQLEWYRNEQKLVAVGNAVATKQDQKLKGDVLTAYYEKVQLEDGTQKTQIQKIISEGNVILEMPNSGGEGTYFEYSIPMERAILKGNPAKLNNKQGEISATKSITYYMSQNKSVALGDVVAKNTEYTIYAEKMISFFDEDKKGKKTLNRVEMYSGTKPVKIINSQAVVTGNYGIYFPITNKLKLYKNIVINQKGDILKGDYAETDLTTGISRLLSAKKTGRVTGIFHNKKK